MCMRVVNTKLYHAGLLYGSKSLTWMPTAEKAMKERDRTQTPVAKKERANHKCWWQTKNGFLASQSSKQLTPNERNKTAETTSKPPNGCLPASIWWKKHQKQKKTKKNKPTKPQQSNRLLSATKEWMTTVIRAQNKTVPTANRWKAKLSITNSKLTPH